MEKGRHNQNRKESFRFIRNHMPFYSISLILIFLLKCYYSRAGAAQLLWLLAPTAGWVRFLSGIPFVYIEDVGYVNHGMKLIIAPSCSGMQFMLIAAAMLQFSFVHLAASGRGPHCRQKMPSSHPECFRVGAGFAWMGISIAVSYFFTIFVNGLRIITAIYLPLLLERLQLFGNRLSPDSLHTIIGTVVYFAALLTLYRLTGYLFHRTAEDSLVRKCLSPVFWYFFIVLGIPFLNRAYERNGAQFMEFAVLITACCGGILLLYYAGLLLCKFCK